MTDARDTPAADDLPSSWAEEENESPRRKRWPWVVAGVVVVVLIAAGVIAVLTGATDTEREWEKSVSGRPPGLGENEDTAADVTPGAEVSPGVYLWSGFDGWHLWVVNGEGVAGAKGTITSTHDFESAVLSNPGKGTVSVDGKDVTFELPAEPQLVGIDFQPGFYSKELTVDIDGPDGPIDPNLITLGPSTKATDNPVVITSQKKDA